MPSFNPGVINLPIVGVLPALLSALTEHLRVVLEAAPGAGKSTMVPLALLEQPWLGGQKILMLEPRRIAARATAERMAALLGEKVGETVGYRMRMESRISAKTQIEVVTEGVLTRMLQDDAALADVGIVIFDEFHERSLQADLGLALTLQVQQTLREDLRVLLMSATLDGAGLCTRLDAAHVVSAGRVFPVELRYAPPGKIVGRAVGIEAHTASVVRQALAVAEGDVLVFLPGKREIQRVADVLASYPLGEVDVLPLHGDLELRAQHAVLVWNPARRRVILATNIAETSLTIEGVRAVVDAGLLRVAQFDPASGMTRLVTQRVSRANAEQRRGRAGRVAAGVCFRLWGEGEHAALMVQGEAEIRRADMLPLVLELAVWGTAPDELFWLDPPPVAAMSQARDVLHALGAVDAAGRVTAHGRVLVAMPLHPRLAHILIHGARLGLGTLAAEVAALLSERDLLRGSMRGQEARFGCDMALRLQALRQGGRELPTGMSVDEGARSRVRQVAKELVRRVPVGVVNKRDNVLDDDDATGVLLILAYPERLAQATGSGRFVLANGRAAQLEAVDGLAREAWLAVAHVDAQVEGRALDGSLGNARVFMAAKISLAAIEQVFAEEILPQELVAWDSRTQAVTARVQRRLGGLVLEDKPLLNTSTEVIQAALLQGIEKIGLACLPWQPRHMQWRGRVIFLRRVLGETWPDVCDAALLSNLEVWLAPSLHGMSRVAHLERLDLDAALRGLLDWPQQAALERLAATHVEVPSGSRIALDYAPSLDGEGVPVLPVKLQELFGLLDTPRVVDGKVPVLIHMLSPARKPLAVTQDLASFWRGAYQDVRKDMRGRYPRHPWPEDPLTAMPTRHTKARMGT
jgi:ATP-dependent helicase HrpB